MSLNLKTAKIPLLGSRLGGPVNGFVGQGHDVVDTSADQWASLSEQTLAQLSDRVHQIKDRMATAEPVGSVNLSVESISSAPLEAVATERQPTIVPDNSRRDDSSPAGQIDRVEMTINSMVELVTERSAEGVPLLLLFIGSEPNMHTDETAARLAAALCDETESRVLLIDSDTDSRNLTAAARLTADSGITEVIQRNQGWENLLLRNENANLDFLPCGREEFQRWNKQELLRAATCQMRKKYQYICVSAGDAHSKAAKMWTDVCDGSFLLVSVKNSNSTVAKSAVTELKSGGARLLGCIVTDVD